MLKTVVMKIDECRRDVEALLMLAGRLSQSEKVYTADARLGCEL